MYVCMRVCMCERQSDSTSRNRSSEPDLLIQNNLDNVRTVRVSVCVCQRESLIQRHLDYVRVSLCMRERDSLIQHNLDYVRTVFVSVCVRERKSLIRHNFDYVRAVRVSVCVRETE